jgi:hypothetical protein
MDQYFNYELLLVQKSECREDYGTYLVKKWNGLAVLNSSTTRTRHFVADSAYFSSVVLVASSCLRLK